MAGGVGAVPLEQLRLKAGCVRGCTGQASSRRLLCAAPHAAQAPPASPGPPHSPGAAARSGVHATSLLSAHLAGTTGFPKAAALSHRNIVNNSLFVGQGCKYSDADRWGKGVGGERGASVGQQR